MDEIVLAKKILQMPIFKDGDCLRLFLFFISNGVLYNEDNIHIRGHVLDLYHGESAYNLSSLSTKIGLSIQKIRSRISILEQEGLIKKNAAKQYFEIRVIDFDQYLLKEDKMQTMLELYNKEHGFDK